MSKVHRRHRTWEERTRCGLPFYPNHSDRASYAAVGDRQWLMLPEKVRCGKCEAISAKPKKWKPRWPSPAEVVTGIECWVAELAKLGDAMRAGEHRCWMPLYRGRIEPDPCPCGAVSWTSSDKLRCLALEQGLPWPPQVITLSWRQGGQTMSMPATWFVQHEWSEP